MKQTIPAFLHAVPKSWAEPGELPYDFRVWPVDMSSAGYVFLGQTELEFDIPSHEDIIARHVVTLREKIKEVYKDAERQATDLRDQLSKLEAVGYTAPASDAS